MEVNVTPARLWSDMPGDVRLGRDYIIIPQIDSPVTYNHKTLYNFILAFPRLVNRIKDISSADTRVCIALVKAQAAKMRLESILTQP